MKKKIMLLGSSVMVFALSAAPAFAAYDPATFSVTDTISTSMTDIVAAAMDGITATLPLAVPVLGIMAAVGLGLKIFRKLTGRA